MRRCLLIIVVILASAKLPAQNDAFVLVDVSGSINDVRIINESRSIITDILRGSVNLGSYPGWESVNIADPVIQKIVTGVNQTITQTGSFLCIMPLGNKDRYKEYVTTRLNNLPGDLISFLHENYPVTFTDDYTYLQIAQAYTALIAEQQKIFNYFIFILTDDLGDQDNTSSQNLFDQQEQDLILAWNNPLFSQVTSLGSIRKGSFFINVKKVTLLKSRKGEELGECELKLLSYPGGKPGQEIKVQSDMVNISWDCRRCREGTKFVVSITSIDGKPANNIRKETLSSSLTTKIRNGKYKVTLSAQGCRSDSTFIQVRTGGGNGLLMILLIIGAAIGGYFIWRYLQDRKARTKFTGEEFPDRNEPVIVRKKENDDPDLF